MSQSQAPFGRTVKCPHCGAALEITPDALAYLCKYCGWVGTTEDVSTKGWMMASSITSAAAQNSLNDFLKKHLKHAYAQSQIIEFKGLAMPMWISKVHAHTRYSGYKQETRSESHPMSVPAGRGGQRTEMQTRSYPVYVPVKGVFDEVLIYPILGRRHAVFFGLEELKNLALAAATQPLDVKTLLDQKMECLDVELEETEVKAAAESLAEDEHRKRAEGMTTKLFDCYTDDDVLSSTLVFYPICVAKYSYRDRSFRATLDGVSGTVMKAELPLTLGLRLAYVILGYVGVGLSVISGLLSLSIDEPASALVPMAIGSGLAAWSFLKATAAQKVKRG